MRLAAAIRVRPEFGEDRAVAVPVAEIDLVAIVDAAGCTGGGAAAEEAETPGVLT